MQIFRHTNQVKVHLRFYGFRHRLVSPPQDPQLMNQVGMVWKVCSSSRGSTGEGRLGYFTLILDLLDMPVVLVVQK